jgi:glycosyltransferase involved in cell wall biosynthesis
MRVLTFSSLFPNSVDPAHGIFVFRRTSNLANIPGVEAEVIAPVPWAPERISPTRWRRFAAVPDSEAVGQLQVHHPRYFLIPKISMPIHGLLMFLRTIALARRLHRQKGFDCINAHYVYPDGFAAVLLGKWLRVPVVVWALGTDINQFPSFPTIRPLIRWTLRNSSGVVAVASPLKRAMIGLGVPDRKIRVIGNGVDTDLFRLMPKIQARDRLGLSHEDNIVVSVATLREAKGHQHVIAALAKLTRRQPAVKLWLVGEGEYRPTLEKLVRKLSLQNHVFFAGGKDAAEIPLWFSAADVSVLASSREGWPNVILESLACGTPVVATPVGQIPEILADGDLGIIADQNPDSLAAAIEAALDRSWDRELLAQYACRRPWRAVAQEIESYLLTVISNGNKTAP